MDEIAARHLDHLINFANLSTTCAPGRPVSLGRWTELRHLREFREHMVEASPSNRRTRVWVTGPTGRTITLLIDARIHNFRTIVRSVLRRQNISSDPRCWQLLPVVTPPHSNRSWGRSFAVRLRPGEEGASRFNTFRIRLTRTNQSPVSDGSSDSGLETSYSPDAELRNGDDNSGIADHDHCGTILASIENNDVTNTSCAFRDNAEDSNWPSDIIQEQRSHRIDALLGAETESDRQWADTASLPSPIEEHEDVTRGNEASRARVDHDMSSVPRMRCQQGCAPAPIVPPQLPSFTIEQLNDPFIRDNLRAMVEDREALLAAVAASSLSTPPISPVSPSGPSGQATTEGKPPLPPG